MSHLVLLLTGLTDAPLQDLGGLTPLQKAHTPQLDQLAREGGCFSAIPPKGGGVETSLLSFLGIEEETSAAPVEACALGLPLKGDETLYCARLVSAGGGAIVEVGDELIGDKEGALLCAALTDEFKGEGVCFVHVKGPKCLVVIENSFGVHVHGGSPLPGGLGPALSMEGTTPREHLPFGPIPGPGPSPFEVVGQSWKALLPKKIRSKLGKLLERASTCLAEHEVNQLRADLEEVPVNALWVSEGGQRPNWMESPQGFEGCEIWCSTSVIQGVAKGLGIPCKELGRSLRMDREIESLLRQLQGQLPETLIIELPHLWESTYKGDLLEKIKRIEYLDRHLIGPLAQSSHTLSLLPLRHTDIRIGHVVEGCVPVVSRGMGGKSLLRFDEVAFSDAPRMPLGKVLSLPVPV